ncbi:MAG: hypothetical protein HOF08_04805 [Candidatus Pacebacteria bacterium]|jgi:hypothetical protein|nr:hypothetical protein [Candidatus Paceibacterota bacterium]
MLDEYDFNWKVKNKKRATHCRDCSRAYIKDHYQKNKKYYLKKAIKRNKDQKEKSLDFISKYLQSHSCVDCGEKDILVLEFDHINRSEKKDGIGSIIRKRLSLDVLKEEVLKCEVRCANCHRRKTEKENGSWRLKYSASSSVD